ncbi:hypothetical protein [Pseudalkalibacillus salsuginis]|uniref:hypothetical protein n=1 Tax=Pseudalkalibacillus salsuginis TaxID=2910972 RepID=UPI001F3167C7|nr:hypothetical protein [Pseudalkalibacillus salsuginis]MCF6408456.1 hypothetical protein [Pseudalkalibacillus salsuginis]
MQILYGVEHRDLKGHSSGFSSQFVRKIAETASILDRDDRLCIVQTESEKQALKDLFERENLYEETFELYPLQSPAASFNTDYGFVSSSNRVYLYKEMTVPFRINDEEEDDIKMAMLQMEEHLVAVDESVNPFVYFADRQQGDLIKQIGSAYQVSVTLL